MVSYVFDKILNSPDRPQRVAQARDWFRDQAENIRANQVSPSRMLDSDRSALTEKLLPGRMYMFTYDPKTKDKLPYYDTFPLSVIVDISGDSFLGLNLHYLPPGMRASMMDALWQRTMNKTTMDEKTQIRISYETMKAVSGLRGYKACLKRYLFSHVRSRFMFVDPNKWDIALMLPTQRFKGASINTIYKDSTAKAR